MIARQHGKPTAGLFSLVAAFCIAPAPASQAQESPLRITYIANEGVMLRTGTHAILIDALFDDPNPLYDAPPQDQLEAMVDGAGMFSGIDLVLVTHNHPDHFSTRVVRRFLANNRNAVLVAPADAVDSLRASTPAWEDFRGRVIALELGVGERKALTPGGVSVEVIRTLHSGSREIPANLMYLIEMNGWTIFHEGDSDGSVEPFSSLLGTREGVDLALVHFWFPFQEEGRRILEVLQPHRVGLIHVPVGQQGLPEGLFDRLDPHVFPCTEPGQEWTLDSTTARAPRSIPPA